MNGLGRVDKLRLGDTGWNINEEKKKMQTGADVGGREAVGGCVGLG